MNKNTTRILSMLKEHSKLLLEQIGTFYPFGIVIDKTNEILPYNVYFGEENPNGEKVLEELTNVLMADLKEGKLKAIGIAIDTSFKDKDYEQNAIEFRVLDESGESFNSYLKYWKDGKIKVGDFFSNNPWERE